MTDFIAIGYAGLQVAAAIASTALFLIGVILTEARKGNGPAETGPRNRKKQRQKPNPEKEEKRRVKDNSSTA